MRYGVIALLFATTLLFAPDPAAVKIQGPDTLGTPVPVQMLPPGAGGLTQTQLNASATNAATAQTATLTGAASVTTYITGFEVTGSGATAASVIQVTVTGTLGGTLQYTMAIPAGATVGVTPLVVEYTQPIASSAVNTSIVVNVPSFGTGNTNASVVAHGFRQ
jgi:hypothetical protein